MNKDSILGQSHALVDEFPEYRDRIHDMKMSNAHFTNLLDEYTDTNREIIKIEQGMETPSDEYTETLKKQRLNLKDQLFAMLHKEDTA